MLKFFHWLLGLNKVEQKQEVRQEVRQEEKKQEERKPAKKIVLSAEADIVRSIRRHTDVDARSIYGIIRQCEWPVMRKPGRKDKYYDQRTRSAIIYYVNKRLGITK